MKTSFSWLKEYVPDLDVSPKEYMDKMTLSGTKVESFEQFDADLDKIVTGKITNITRHPDADKLVICKVDVGEDEDIQIVTGAPNVFEGAVVPVVLAGGKVAGGHDGTKTPGGVKIKKGKLRGQISNGMMCSITELGSDSNMYPEADEDGIYIFGDDTKLMPGDDPLDYLGLHDTVFEYEITSNRVDCYSTLGVAREAAATFGKKFHYPVIKDTKEEGDINDYIKVTVKDGELCPRYAARVVKDVKIAPSPRWLQRRLSSIGIRPINNLVDITNYVMEEFGQPMHAYDYDRIEGGEIIVERADEGEEFTTLDGQKRTLSSDTLMICDGKKRIGVAGIMGGENSMVTDDVKTILFEAANFNGTNIRKTSRKLGLRTDASGKFEKGLDPNTAQEAINRACQLVEELGCGTVVGGMVDFYPDRKEGNTVPFEPERINALLGTSIPKEKMLGIFENIDLTYDHDTNEIRVPSWRQDVKIMEDLAEEVARFYGYDKIPVTLPGGSSAGRLSSNLHIEAKVRDAAVSLGYSQSFSYSFESPGVLDKLLFNKDDEHRKVIEISNPLGEDFSVMRTVPVGGMLSSLGLNYSRRNDSARLFEIATVYIPKDLPPTELPDEKKRLVLGNYHSGDFYDMKGDLEEILGKTGISTKLSFEPAADIPFLHPGRAAVVKYRKDVIGYLGEVHPTVAKNYEIGKKACLGVLYLDLLYGISSFDVCYKPLPKFPAVNRDISLIVPKDVLSSHIESVIKKRGKELLESVELFDVYEGEQVDEGKKSLAYTMRFRSIDRTLTDDEVGVIWDDIIKDLGDMGISLRC